MNTFLLNAHIARKQATGVQTKNLVSILLTIRTMRAKRVASNRHFQKNSEHFAHYLLATFWERRTMWYFFLFMFIIGPYGRDQMILEKFIMYLDSTWRY